MTYESWLLYMQGQYKPKFGEFVTIGSPFEMDDKKFYIGVFEEENDIPHFHILYGDTGEDYCSLRLDAPEYMEDTPNILTDNQLERLQQKIYEADALYPFNEHLWSLIVVNYTTNNFMNRIPLKWYKIPDYTILKGGQMKSYKTIARKLNITNLNKEKDQQLELDLKLESDSENDTTNDTKKEEEKEMGNYGGMDTLTVKEAADKTGLTVSKIYKSIKNGTLVASNIGDGDVNPRYCISEANLYIFLKKYADNVGTKSLSPEALKKIRPGNLVEDSERIIGEVTPPPKPYQYPTPVRFISEKKEEEKEEKKEETKVKMEDKKRNNYDHLPLHNFEYEDDLCEPLEGRKKQEEKKEEPASKLPPIPTQPVSPATPVLGNVAGIDISQLITTLGDLQQKADAYDKLKAENESLKNQLDAIKSALSKMSAQFLDLATTAESLSNFKQEDHHDGSND